MHDLKSLYFLQLSVRKKQTWMQHVNVMIPIIMDKIVQVGVFASLFDLTLSFEMYVFFFYR